MITDKHKRNIDKKFVVLDDEESIIWKAKAKVAKKEFQKILLVKDE
jgi:hypothetical protein